MQRDTTVRPRVIDYLIANGPIEDKSGRATSRLKDAVGYAGGDAGFIRIVGLMADAGEILREVRGKRTYRIAAPAGAVASNSAPVAEASGRVGIAAGSGVERSSTEPGDLDYDELASSLLAKVAALLNAPQPAGGDAAAWARRRIEQLETKVTALQRDLARAKAETDSVREEREALRSQLEAATHNIDVLTERLGSNQRPSGRAASRLDSEEQALLHRLGHRRPPREAV